MLTISAINAFEDNYIWLLINPDTCCAVIIDPGHATPVLKTLHAQDLKLSAILLTHHHHDHIGGVVEILQQFTVPVYGPTHKAIPAITHPVKEGDIITLASLDLNLGVIETPGHTLEHIIYTTPQQLFSGDTLFTGGCGRLFEGTASQMYQSLQKISTLSDNLLVYCAHEYTKKNLEFALCVEPDNTSLQQRYERICLARAQQQITVPEQLSVEKSTNPFLRCNELSVKHAAEKYIGHQLKNPIEVFSVIRQWKDGF
jgi:hydroxyacylglutathione hydrolase